jgi:putative hydrolase of the HAD superfamily
VSRPAIRAVLFDFGGVITSSPFEAFRRFEAERGLPEGVIRRINATNPDDNAWAKLERSEVDVDGFCRLFGEEARAAGCELDGREVLALLSGDLRPQMVAAVSTIARHYRTACLTNNVRHGHGPGMSADPERAAAIAAVMGLFDAVVESSKVGVRKPQPEFYRMACRMLDVAPEEAVFLDDLGVNLKPAAAMGIRTIKVVDPDAALAELEGLLGLALR